MIYTFQRRRALNRATSRLFPSITFEEEVEGVPMMYTYTLPSNARRIDDISQLLEIVDASCTQVNEMGVRIVNSRKVLPVFVQGREIQGQRERIFWRVNYVSPTEFSKRKAAEYVERGDLFVIHNN